MLLIGMFVLLLILWDICICVFLLYFLWLINSYEYVFGKFMIVVVFLMFIMIGFVFVCYLFGVVLLSDLIFIFDIWDFFFWVVIVVLVFIVLVVFIVLMFLLLIFESCFVGFVWFVMWGFGFLGWNII